MYLLYPDVCEVCRTPLVKGEKTICLKCLADMPYTTFHNEPENMICQLFWGKIRIEMATALFYFAKGSRYRKLLHRLKYNNRPEIGIVLGRELGARIGNSKCFEKIDYIVPVPLHSSRQKQRGYNQSEKIGIGISQVTQIPVFSGAIIRNTATQTQTRKNREERWKNVSGKFSIPNENTLFDKHILLVDDVITTGSTIEAVATELLKVKGLKISLAVLAKA